MSTFKNFVQCRVTTPISAVADSIGLYAAVPPYALPSEEGGLLVLTDSPNNPSKLEVISYTSRSALGLYGVTRGLEGTTAQAWTGPVYCYQSLLAGEFKTLLDSKADIVALGTAAARDVGTAIGDVMEVGAFGLGHTFSLAVYDADEIANQVDNKSGFYPYISAIGSSNVPYGFVYINQLFFDNDGLSGLMQIAYGVNNDSSWIRTKLNGVWSLWVKQLSTGDMLQESGPSTTLPMSQNAATEYTNYQFGMSQLFTANNFINNDRVKQVTGASESDLMSQKAVTDLLATKAASSHTHPWVQVTGQPATATRWPTLAEVTGKPDNYPTNWATVSDKPVVQTVGASTTNLMSQKAVSDLFASIQPSITGSCTANGTTDNTLVLTGIVSALALEEGDVIQITGSTGGLNDKLFTVESITDANSIIVNYEHSGNRGNGSLKLADQTATVTIKRITKWYNAPLGLGQAWVDVVTVMNTVYAAPANRAIGFSCSFASSGNNNALQISPDGGVTWVTTARSADSVRLSVSATVPANNSYKYTTGLAPSTVVSELR